MDKRVEHFTWTAILAALVALLGMTPLGLIPLGFINVTILCVPVILGTLLLGLRTGLILGAVFGAISTARMFMAPSALVAPLLGANTALAVIMCILPRLLIPVVAHLSYKSLLKGRFAKIAPAIASACGSLTNTVFYLGLMLVFYQLAGLDSTAVRALILGTGLIAGTSEAVVAALLVPPILIAVKKMMKRA